MHGAHAASTPHGADATTRAEGSAPERSDDAAGTRIPRWTGPRPWPADPAPLVLPVPADLLGRVERVCREHGVRPGTALLAAHLAVLRTLTSQPELRLGHLDGGAAGGVPWPVGVVLEPGSWADLLQRAARAAAGPVAAWDPGDAPLAVVVDTGAVAAGPAEARGAAPERPMLAADLQVEYHAGPRPALALRSRAAVMDDAHLARIGAYHLAALRALADDPGARYDEAVLLDGAEIAHQVDGLAGPRPPADGRLFTDRFREQVAATPDRVAVSFRDTSRTYRELDADANRVAHALLAEGLAAEDLVAVVAERGPEWIAAVIGVFKAGGVYYPVPPGLPPARTAAQLAASGARFAVADAPGRDRLAAAAAATPGDGACAAPLRVVPAVPEGTGDPGDPGAVIGPEQAAYLYFTSGSTGTPKGVVCEHAGMVNHLLMKIEDFDLTERDVVAQTSSQGLDISLWQALAVLLVGGRVRVVDTVTTLEVDRFVDELVGDGVRVVQTIPSHFDVVVSYLEASGRRPGGLRLVSVTGETLRREIVRRWFSCCPGTELVNAYGATEVSDDTMHERLAAVPERPFVSVGRPGRNVRCYVLDERQRLVPLGTPGEVAFAGVCVGRGYLNVDTGAFGTDPYRPGERMYRTGDFGRWLPEGRLEFLGRRDQQVKIRGFRVELGEVENVLLGSPDVRDAAVVTAGEGRTLILVAFVVGRRPLDPAGFARWCGERLPGYMVPTYVHQLDAMPLNENGKLDRRALGELAATLGHAERAHLAPGTPGEIRLATIWAEILDVPLERIGRHDDFFAIGGSSLTAVWLVVKLDGQLTLSQILHLRVLRDLAAALDEQSRGDRPLLQPLSPPVPGAVATLVGLPDAGGNAVNFQALASLLAPARVAVLGVELPGHDLADADPGPVPAGRVAGRLAAEIAAGVSGPVLLWGQGAGAAHALATARALEREHPGVPLLRVLLADAVLPPAPRLRADLERVAALDDRDVVAALLDTGAYVEFDGLRVERSRLVGAAYRRTLDAAGRYLLGAREDPPAHLVGAPVDVVVTPDVAAEVAADVAGLGPVLGWEAVAPAARRCDVPAGDRHLPRTAAAAAAELVIKACRDLLRPAAR